MLLVWCDNDVSSILGFPVRYSSSIYPCLLSFLFSLSFKTNTLFTILHSSILCPSVSLGIQLSFFFTPPAPPLSFFLIISSFNFLSFHFSPSFSLYPFSPPFFGPLGLVPHPITPMSLLSATLEQCLVRPLPLGPLARAPSGAPACPGWPHSAQGCILYALLLK